MKEDQLEDKNRKKALAISLGSHVILLIIFIMIAAWSEPDPPIPEYGIELAFVGQSNAVESKSTTNNDVNKQTEPIVETTTEQPLDTEPQQTQSEDVVQEKVEETTDVSQETQLEDSNSPDVNTDKTENTSVEQSEDVVEEIVEPVKTNNESLDEVKKDSLPTITEPEPKLDDRALFQGNDGREDQPNAKSSSTGPSLDMSGWEWDSPPEPDDKSTENGKIVFKITVGEDGEVIGIQTLEKTVSPVVANIYKSSVMELTFNKTADNKSVASTSTGTITFIIQSK